MTDIVPLDACEPRHVRTVGGKAVGLGSLLRENLQVPPGFALGVHCYHEFVTQTGIAAHIDALLAGADSLEQQAEASRRIRLLFEGRELAPGLRQDLARAYRGLGSDAAVAVCSSAPHEDSAGASFAGGHESYLAVTGEAALSRAVLRCWASLFTPQALAHFRRVGIPATRAAMGVVVQAMVSADAAGVMLTVDPVSGDRSQIAIEGSVGLGAAVVSGEVSPDRYFVDKVTLEIHSRVVSDKHLAYRFDARLGKVHSVAVPERERRAPCLTDSELVEIASLGRLVERVLGAPQDIEWAIERRSPEARDVFLLQTRPQAWSAERPGKSTGARRASCDLPRR
jgi:phosphoenolpyruvate synthase/pyruvate phosphate dikinase